MGGTYISKDIYGRFITGFGLAFFATKDLENSLAIFVDCGFEYKVVIIEVQNPEILEKIKGNNRSVLMRTSYLSIIIPSFTLYSLSSPLRVDHNAVVNSFR